MNRPQKDRLKLNPGPIADNKDAELTKRVESGEKKIEAIDKKVETYNSRVDQIPRAPPILKGLDSKKLVQKPFPPCAAPKPIPKKFRMPEIPKYNGTTDPNEHGLLHYDLAQRDPNLMCKYHGTHGHRTVDCRQLREEVARLFNNGHLRGFLSDRAKNHFRNRDSNKQTEQEEPQRVINMIIGGFDIPQGPMLKRTKVSITKEKWTRDYIPEGTVSFNDEDAEGIVQPHNNALIGLQDQIVHAVRGLNGFNMVCETTKGEITLPVNTAGTIQETKFYVIKGDMRYPARNNYP
ncbi:PREDICTED: uncharacterized protein LOC109228072 [Nicotiana attenuata]|uniref:uncharacterized protein LOC109228072 n=1 Tax=Nicotiana attenuata TaxID=49451 RepID=UPI000904AC6D|nr:PREDICTED: uncharacterized protein LOC109228072 [Nicotiana attenuata]